MRLGKRVGAYAPKAPVIKPEHGSAPGQVTNAVFNRAHVSQDGKSQFDHQTGGIRYHVLRGGVEDGQDPASVNDYVSSLYA